MQVDVPTFYPVTTHFFIFPETFQSCSSVSFYGGCTDILSMLVVVLLSICFPLQPNKRHPSVISERMVMGLQDA
jgi:hypothetical protein